MNAIKKTCKNIVEVLLILLAYATHKVFSYCQVIRDYIRKIIKYQKFKKKLEKQNKQQNPQH